MESDHSLKAVLTYLENIAGKAQRSPAEQKSIADRRNTLRLVCNAMKNPRAAWAFLNTWNVAYGAAPIETCVDAESYEELKMAASKIHA